VFQVVIPESENWDETKEEFVQIKSVTFQIEHSLVSLSRWESKWNIPFLEKNDKTTEQIIDYVRCMTTTQNVDPKIYQRLTAPIFSQISEYIEAPMTATWFNDELDAARKKEVITAEIIYYWMIVQNIPLECQKWHLNRLLTLIRVCSIKNAPPKKMGRKDMLAQRKALNETRRNRINSKG